MVDVSPSPAVSDHEMVDAPLLPSSAFESPIESDHEMVDVMPPSSVSSTNPKSQSKGAGSSSGKRKKKPRRLITLTH
jgi:hypothetical protein